MRTDGPARSANEALLRCRAAARSYEDAATPEGQDEGLVALYNAFSRLDIYLRGGAELPEPWKIAAQLDAYRATGSSK